MQMWEYDPTDEDRMSREDFVALAERILDKFNTDNLSNDWVEIRRNYNGLKLEITRQAQRFAAGTRNDHLRVSNPTTMVTKDGEIIRHHGEYVWLTRHMKELAGE